MRNILWTLLHTLIFADTDYGLQLEKIWGQYSSTGFVEISHQNILIERIFPCFVSFNMFDIPMQGLIALDVFESKVSNFFFDIIGYCNTPDTETSSICFVAKYPDKLLRMKCWFIHSTQFSLTQFHPLKQPSRRNRVKIINVCNLAIKENYTNWGFVCFSPYLSICSCGGYPHS